MSTVYLVLFFTRGISLQTWARIGSLDREIALYLRLRQKKGARVSFVTYGDKTDLQYHDDLGGIEILCNRWNLPQPWYERMLPLLHAPALSRANLIKTNQTNGADVALHAAKFWRKPLIARCGYMWSDLARSSGREAETRQAQTIERSVFRNADRVMVTTASMRNYVISNYGVSRETVCVIPNFVLTDVFSPSIVHPLPNRICFIGRLSEEKNLFSLVQACAGLDVELHFVGEGPLGPTLREKAGELGVKLTLHGSVPHQQLPDILRQSTLFTLVSPHEGHPKSLLEAMSCGVAVLGADSPGIREQIIHGVTGWLCGTDVQSIRVGIQYLLSNPLLREELGRNARRFILENYSIDKIVEMEYSIYQETLET